MHEFHGGRVIWRQTARAAPHSASTSASVSSPARSAARSAKAGGGNSRESAQTAAPRTSGEGSRSKLAACCRPARRSPELPAAISTLRTNRSRPMRLTGEPEKSARKAASSSSSSRASARLAQIVAGDELRLGSGAGEFVPRTDGEAVVAAIDAVADRCAEFVRDRTLVLDGQVGDAAPRIEPVGRRKGIGRADVETGAAGAAVIVFGRVRCQLGGGEDACRETATSRIRG